MLKSSVLPATDARTALSGEKATLRKTSPSPKLLKISSQATISMEIFISVGVSEGILSGARVCMAVGGLNESVGGEEGSVGNTWTEKLQASSNSVINTKQMSSGNDL
jgi:hypothetical protein